jgi:hypothetical protein
MQMNEPSIPWQCLFFCSIFTNVHLTTTYGRCLICWLVWFSPWTINIWTSSDFSHFKWEHPRDKVAQLNKTGGSKYYKHLTMCDELKWLNETGGSQYYNQLIFSILYWHITSLIKSCRYRWHMPYCRWPN